MLMDANVTIAYKCNFCGSFEFFNVSLFVMKHVKNCGFSCRCKKSWISVKQDGEDGYLFNIPCIGCGNGHACLFKRRSMLAGQIETVCCPDTGIQICIIGRDDAVRKRIDNLEKEFDKLMDEYGYESYFRNTQVMFDVLNRLHDMALNGNLYCECGNADIELTLLPDCILLSCARCGSIKRIPAARNKDLKKIPTKSGIMIADRIYQYDAGRRKNLVSGRSGNKFGK